MLHECIHAAVGDVTKANYGVPFGLPYGVPESIPPSEEEAYLAPFNFGEARAFVGVWILGRAMFRIDWDLRTARDVGTYGFVGGNALVSVHSRLPPGGAHRSQSPHGALLRARAKARSRGARLVHRRERERGHRAVGEAAAKGRASRPKKWPEPEDIARLVPKKVGRNEQCPCGSNKKVKQCCGDSAGSTVTAPQMAR